MSAVAAGSKGCNVPMASNILKFMKSINFKITALFTVKTSGSKTSKLNVKIHCDSSEVCHIA